MPRLANKYAVITGTGSGIGRVAAGLFAREGAAVACLDLDKNSARETAAQIESAGGRSLAVQCDVTSEESVITAVKTVLAAFGGLDICWANAGGGAEGRAGDLEKDVWDRAIAVNLTGAWLTAKHVLPALIKSGRGSLIFTASTTGFRGAHNVPAMAAAKAGVMGLTRQIAMDYAAERVRVNAVLPGGTMTPTLVGKFNERAEQLGMTGQALLDAAASITPLGRLAEPEDIANAALFLASDEASHITGEWLAIDGGLFVKYG